MPWTRDRLDAPRGLRQLPRPTAAVTLQDGRVVVLGGGYTDMVRVFDPATSTWSDVGTTALGVRREPTGTRLPNGEVLIVGGLQYDAGVHVYLAPEIVTGDIPGRFRHEATLLLDGRVLVTGGVHYDPEGYPHVHAHNWLYSL